MNAQLRQDVLDLAFDGLETDEIAAVLGISADAVLDAMDDICGYKDYDDSMDGDFDSAMASAGFGTDEDYGYAGEDCYYGAEYSYDDY